MVTLSNEAVPVSDRDLEHRVNIWLLDRNAAASRQVVVRADSGTVTVRGTVTSFYLKQLCIQACLAVPGVVAMVDEVEVDAIM
jgi:osmotically-inducible protein OsmY